MLYKASKKDIQNLFSGNTNQATITFGQYLPNAQEGFTITQQAETIDLDDLNLHGASEVHDLNKFYQGTLAETFGDAASKFIKLSTISNLNFSSGKTLDIQVRGANWVCCLPEPGIRELYLTDPYSTNIIVTLLEGVEGE